MIQFLAIRKLYVTIELLNVLQQQGVEAKGAVQNLTATCTILRTCIGNLRGANIIDCPSYDNLSIPTLAETITRTEGTTLWPKLLRIFLQEHHLSNEIVFDSTICLENRLW